MLLSTRVFFLPSPLRVPYRFANSQPRSLPPIKSSISEEEGGDDPETSSLGAAAAPKPIGLQFRRISRRRRKQQRQEEEEESAAEKKAAEKASSSSVRKKEWDGMTLTEKAVEVYMGEKGVLFWLNKFSYASIFVVIGGWILFRFVGPALNLYQLDSPPLSPTSMFKS